MSSSSHNIYGAKVELDIAFSVQDVPGEFRHLFEDLMRALKADPSVSGNSRPHSLPKVLAQWLEPCLHWLRENSPMPGLVFDNLSTDLVLSSPDRAAALLRAWHRSLPRDIAVCCDALLEVLVIIQVLAPGAKVKHVISPTHLESKGAENLIGGNPVYTKRGTRKKAKSPDVKLHRYRYLRNLDSRYCKFCGCLTEMECRRMEMIAEDKTPAIDKALLIDDAPLIQDGLSNSHCADHKSGTPGYGRGRRVYRHISALSYLARMQTGVFLMPAESDNRPIVAEIFRRLGVEHRLMRNLPQLCQTLDPKDYGGDRAVWKRLNKEFRNILEEMIVLECEIGQAAKLDIERNAALGAKGRGARIRKPPTLRLRQLVL